ncbi:MAG: protein kinase [Kiritimatiellia bacterium]
MRDGTTTEALVEEYLSALRGGAAVDEAAFIAAHPDHAGELGELLPLLAEMEEYGRNRRRSAPAVPCVPPELTGSDYQLRRILGRGGMGTVWEGLQVSLNRKVAVKVLTPPPRCRKEAWRERFSREAKIVAQLHHPGIVKVYGAGTCGDLCYYAMELVDGTSFNKVDFPDVRAIVRAVLQAAQALAYAHRCGVVHRDVKPANLMRDAAGEVRVTDFGLAAVWGEGEDDREARSGTLRYMSPERLTAGRCSFAADQYALGVTLWELLAHEPLFAGVSGTALFRKICSQAIPRLTGVDSDLAAIVAKSVALKPADRYADMAAFAEDLRRWLDHEAVFAAPPAPGRRLRLWARRKPAMAGLAAVSVVCLLAFVGALVAGYARTSAALRLAARNAKLADEALGEVFHHVESVPPSKRDVALLSALLPYYGRLAGEQGLDPGKSAEVNEVLGVCALRSGDYMLAERAFRRLVAVRPSAAALNRLAETLRRLGRHDEAGVFQQRVIEEYEHSPNATDRYEAALALEAQGRSAGRSKARRRAFLIARELRTTDTANPDFRFLYARLLAESPGMFGGTKDGSERLENAFALLGDLATDYPDRPEYGRALVSAVERRLRNGLAGQPVSRTDVELALDTADRLLGRFPNVPDIVSSVVSFRDTYAAYLRKTGDVRRANRESVRTTGMLELLSHNAESPDAARMSFTCADGSLAYRQIVVGSSLEDDRPAVLVLALHDRARNGNDNVRQMTAPFLRTLVTAAETQGRKVVILLPQCPGGRENLWLGARKKARDGLLRTVARLVRTKTQEFRVSPERVLVAGVDSGADAAWVLLAQEPALFARALLAGAGPVPADAAPKIVAQVRLCLGEADRQCPPDLVRSSVAPIGLATGHPVVVRVLPGETHKTVVDNAFSEEALDWFLDPAGQPGDPAEATSQPSSIVL